MRTIFLATAAVLCLAMPARATVWGFSNVLDGVQETPPNDSPATGYVSALLDDVARQITISGSFQGLLGNTDDSHLHCCAPPDTPALILFGLANSPPHTTAGTFTGSSALSALNVQDILNGLSYVNVHTAHVPGGEIRGQLMNPFTTLAGDFNVDRKLDAADYVSWRLGKDILYGDVDYGAWRANFDLAAGSGAAAANTAVPEPGAGIGLAIGAIAWLARRCRPR